MARYTTDASAPRTITARFPGRCPCGAEVAVGTKIAWVPETKRTVGCAGCNFTGDAPARRAIGGFELWALCALRILAGLDPDRAGTRNNVGFSKYDTHDGHAYAVKGLTGLTPREWHHAVIMAGKYARQVGAKPSVDEAGYFRGLCAYALLETPDYSEALRQAWADYKANPLSSAGDLAAIHG